MAGKSRNSQVGLVVLALARGLSYAAAARESGLSVRTISRLASREDVKASVRVKRDQIVNRTAAKLSVASLGAVKILMSLAENGADSIKLGACRSLLEFAAKFAETDELANRIAAIEMRLTNESAKST